ncbi:TetR family transcriptional regulator [Serpentinimonas barnesii]|uniref:TetR family transcriptional regulator n=1 Tax=Serpentinimonas barnesii TaxID=1458427 RepID=UPI0004968F90|nr:TetR family transcriptional regulator [Serpentinimonas barnesii]
MPRQTKAEAELTRQRLLDAAELLFLERGVSRTSLHDIAAAAGATRGAIYWHFQDKADLFNAMMERATLPLEQAFAALDEQGMEPRVRLRSLFAALVGALGAVVHDARTQRVFAIASHKIEFVSELDAVFERRRVCLQQAAAQTQQVLQAVCAATGRSLPMPAGQVAEALFVLFDGLISNWLIDRSRFDLLQLGPQTLRVFFRGLGLDDLIEAQ